MTSCKLFFWFLSVRGMSTPHGKAEHRRGRNHPVMLHRGPSPCSLNINPSFVHSPLTLLPDMAETIKAELTARTTPQQSYLFVPRHKIFISTSE